MGAVIIVCLMMLVTFHYFVPCAGEDAHDICDEVDNKWMYRLAVLLVNSAIGIVFILMTLCWFKGCCCFKRHSSFKDGPGTEDVKSDIYKLTNGKPLTSKNVKRDNEIQIPLTMVSVHNNLKTVMGSRAKDDCHMNEIVFQDLLKTSCKSAPTNVYALGANSNC